MLCHSLSEALPVERAGGKAANLARLSSLGLSVPATMVLERAALGRVLETSGLDARLKEYVVGFGDATSAEIERAFASLAAALRSTSLPIDLERELRQAAATLLEGAPSGLAVRSSAVYEDGEGASFAGVFESYLGVSEPGEVVTRVVDCWCSSLAPRVLRYLGRMGIEPALDSMAVILQQVVPARAAGVLTTADPDTGDPWRFVLHVAPGLAVDLLSGSGAGDRLELEWDSGAILDQRLAGEAPVLTASEAAGVAAVARRIDQTFDGRVDVEWALGPGDDDLWMIQARPLTALPPYFPVSDDELSAADRERTWDRAWFVVPLRSDLPPALLTPLYRDLSESEMWYRYQPEDIVLTGIWKEERDLSGFRYVARAHSPTFLDSFPDFSEIEPWLERNESRYRRRWDQRLTELEAIVQAARSAASSATSAVELIPAMLEARERIWDLNSFGWSGPQALGWMCEALLRHAVQQRLPEFRTEAVLGGGADSYTFTVTRSLQELGRSIDEPSVRGAFARLGLGEIVPHLRRTAPDCRFLAELEALAWRFGKTPPSFRDRPAFWASPFDEGDALTMHTIRSALQGSSRDITVVAEEARRERDRCERETRARLAAVAPEFLARFDRMLEQARYWTQALNDRHGLGAGLLWERELIWQVGEHLCGEGVLDAPEDVLLLRREDLEGFVAAANAAGLRSLFIERRREFQWHRRLDPPATIGKLPESQAEPAPATAIHATHDVEAGEVVYEGIVFAGGGVTGRARQVPALSPELLDALSDEDILVLPHDNAFAYADWHSLLTLVRGVASQGRPAHHLSQVARECRVPVIGEVKGDLSRIADGTLVELDGVAGRVRLLRSGGRPSE